MNPLSCPGVSSQEPGPIFGRDPELAALIAAYDEAVAARGSVVLLSGEPGIGKTRLAAALCAAA